MTDESVEVSLKCRCLQRAYENRVVDTDDQLRLRLELLSCRKDVEQSHTSNHLGG